MITIDYQDRRPIYEQIVEKYELLIVRGVLSPDEQMPSVRQMAQELGINPNTIQKAYAILEKDGFIYPVKGRGNFVSGRGEGQERKKTQYMEKLKTLLKEGHQMRVDPAGIRALVDEIFEEERV